MTTGSERRAGWFAASFGNKSPEKDRGHRARQGGQADEARPSLEPLRVNERKPAKSEANLFCDRQARRKSAVFRGTRPLNN
jgi:hypothetical protein